MERICVIYDYEEYYFNGRRWTDSRSLIPPTAILSKLNAELAKQIDFSQMMTDDAIELCSSMKTEDMALVAIKGFEYLLDHTPPKYHRSIYPRLASAYRLTGQPQKAIAMAEKHASGIRSYGSAALYTSLAAAYCDVERYDIARKYANRARAISGGNSSQELISVYCRLKKLEGGR